MHKKVAALICASAVAVLSVACAQSDAGITASVKTRLAADDTVKSYRIDVETQNRIVTLSGAVDTPAARERAVEIARGTDGVTNVVDNLTVTPGATPTTGYDDKVQGEAKDAAEKGRGAGARAGDALSDAAITSAVKSKFLADPAVGGLNIDVDTTNGVVTLTGAVRNAGERQRALELARETTGVTRVVDHLKTR